VFGDRSNQQRGTDRRERHSHRRHSLEPLRRDPVGRRIIEEASREPYRDAGGGRHAGGPGGSAGQGSQGEDYGRVYGEARIEGWQRSREWPPYADVEEAGYGRGAEYGSDSEELGTSSIIDDAGYGRGYDWGEEDMEYGRGTEYGFATTGFGGRGFESGEGGRGHSREADLGILKRYDPVFEWGSNEDRRLQPGGFEEGQGGEYIERSYDLRGEASDVLGGWGEPLPGRPGYATGRRDERRTGERKTVRRTEIRAERYGRRF
jgi:hypothetical protein